MTDELIPKMALNIKTLLIIVIPYRTLLSILYSTACRHSKSMRFVVFSILFSGVQSQVSTELELLTEFPS